MSVEEVRVWAPGGRGIQCTEPSMLSSLITDGRIVPRILTVLIIIFFYKAILRVETGGTCSTCETACYTCEPAGRLDF